MKFCLRLVVPFVVITVMVVADAAFLQTVQVLGPAFDSTAASRCIRYSRRTATSSSTRRAIAATQLGISLSQHDKQQHQQQPQPENDGTTTRTPSKNASSLATTDHWVKGLLSSSTTKSLLFSLFLFLSISFSPTALSRPAMASSYTTALSEEQKVVAEAWRLVDNSFLDRTFNGQDWFQLRQSLVVQKKYKNMDEAHQAIDEMISKLGDKYTRYLSPAKYRSLVDSATGTLGSTGAGVGVQISVNDKGQIIVNDVEPNSPASKAGIRPGDVFIEVDGVRFVDDSKATPDDVAARLRGPEGSKVGVVMMRNGEETLDFRITRLPIKITAVQSYMSSISGVPGKVGVIRIKSFSGTTATTVSKALEELKAKGAQSIVLDVRGNPGGLLPGGVDTASLFLKSNDPIVFVVNKKGIVDAQSALATGMDTESPLVVLVDSTTASAAEVFTAALQENGRATVAGEQTFGKGIVQTIRELSGNNGGVAITVARYETPLHHDINKQGIPVDVPTSVTCAKDDATACLDAKVFRINKNKG